MEEEKRCMQCDHMLFAYSCLFETVHVCNCPKSKNYLTDISHEKACEYFADAEE